jgi:hypothetical protein
MKVIVVSGAHSNVGKTGLARSLCSLLPGAVYIKIGHGKEKPGIDGSFYHLGTPFSSIASNHDSASFLIIESNGILKEITPDCCIYLPAENPKPSALRARKKADIVRGEIVSADTITACAGRLGCDSSAMEQIILLTGAVKG